MRRFKITFTILISVALTALFLLYATWIILGASEGVKTGAGPDQDKVANLPSGGPTRFPPLPPVITPSLPPPEIEVSPLPAPPPPMSPRAEASAPPPVSPKADEDPFEKQRLEIERNLRSVPARYNVPERLTYGRSIEISFVLEPQGAGTGARLLENTPGKIETDVVRVSTQVKALLTGPADLVEIKARGGDEEQRKAVTLTAPVQWVWDVKAIGNGTAILQLELVAFFQNRDKETSFQVTTFRRQIPIEISVIERVKILVADISPIWAFFGTVATGLAGLLAYFGWKPSLSRSQATNGDKKPSKNVRSRRR